MSVPSAEPAHTTPVPTPWGLVVLLGALTALGPLSIDLYLPALPGLTADLKATAAEGQSTIATFFAGMAIGQFVYGPASDRFGRKAPILIGCALYVIATCVCAVATSPSMLIAARFAQALGACSGMVVARAIVRDRFDHTETARMLSLLLLIMGVAPILAPLGGGFVLKFADWRTIFWLMAVFGVVVGLATVFFLKESISPATKALARSENPLAAFLVLFRSRRLNGYILAAALNGAALFSYVAASPDLVMGVYGVPVEWFGLVFGVNAIATIGSSQLNRMLLRRMAPDTILRRAALAAVGSSALLTLFAVTGIGGPWTVLPILFFTLGSYGFMSGNTTAGALSIDPLRSGSISAMSGGAAFGVGAVVTAISGTFHDGTAGPFAVTMLISLTGSALALYGLALRK